MTGIFKTLSPDWKIPNVKAYTILATATDSSPVSFGQFTPLDSECRKKLETLLNPVFPMNWLRQVHGNHIVELPLIQGTILEADGSCTHQKRTICTVITADCLPIVFSTHDGTQVGVAHAGRKGLQNGILHEMIKKFNVHSDEIYVWIGPGIAAQSYPVSLEIKVEVLALSSAYEKVFTVGEQGQILMDLYEVARIQLLHHGILKNHIYGAEWNTFTDNRLHSARRDKELSGRMATVVWME